MFRALLLSVISFPVWAQTSSITFTTAGPHHVFAGSTMHTKVYVQMDAPPAVFSHLYVDAIRAPEGVSVDLSYPHAPLHTAGGRQLVYNVQPGSVFVVAVTVPFIARGEVEIDMQLQPGGSGSLPKTVDGCPPVFTTLKIPFVSQLPARASIDLSKWESEMLTLGRKWCDGRTFGFGTESEVWYYDGARVYFQIADYTGDSSWEKCAYHVADQYRDNLLSRNGGIQGWRVFPHGLEMAYRRTGDERYKQAVLLMAKNSTFAHRGGDANDLYIRETAYIVECWIAAERLGEPRHPMLARAVDYLLGHFDSLFVSGNFRLHQTFFDGLAAEALIEWYNHTGDPRIAPAIKTMLDWIWAHGWRADGRMIYNPEPPGDRCDNSCQSYGRLWINLVIPAYAWYAHVTGDQEYARRGDEMWTYSLADDISWMGKQFSQNYRWSFRYVEWRGGRR